MTNEVQTTNPKEAFRAIAGDRLHTAADMTLHELVDEYLRLTRFMETNKEPPSASEEEWSGGPSLNDAGKLASRERGIIEGAAKARFGLHLSAYDSDF